MRRTQGLETLLQSQKWQPIGIS